VAVDPRDGSGEPDVAQVVEALRSLYRDWRKDLNRKNALGGVHAVEPGPSETASAVDAAFTTEAAPKGSSGAAARAVLARADVVGRFSGSAVAEAMVRRLLACADFAAKAKAVVE